MKPVQILIADDHEVVRQGIKLLLEKVDGWKVVGEAGDGREAVSQAQTLHPDVAIIDVQMPILNGLEVTRQIRRALPLTEVLIFTGTENEQLVHDVFDAGARSYILKSDVTRHLIAAVEALSTHRTYFTTRISEIVFAKYLQEKRPRGEAALPGSRLTPREREIVQLLAEGTSNKEVGTSLGISVKTAETHRASIMRKLGFTAFSELVRYAVRNHIVEA